MNKLAAAVLALVPALALAAPTTWSVDASHSRVGFAVKHLVISTVRGEFSKFQGKVTLDDADVTRSTVEATVDASSIDTKVADRDGHLRSPDFFDTTRHPAVTFRSTKVTAAGKDALQVAGDLTLRGVTRPVVFAVTTSAEVKGMSGETRRAFAGKTVINRKDFGLAWNKAIEAGPVVSDEVTIELELEVVKDAVRTSSR